MTESLTKATVDLDELIGELAEHYAERLRTGERPNIEEYTREHPEAAEAIRQILPALEIMGSVANDDDPAEVDLRVHGSNRDLGDFRILREIGRGGMGVVYEAEQLSLGRRVALKVLPFAAMLDRQQLKRFKNEARAAATLDHPNIVAIHSVGCERSVHYYAMQLIEGQSLAQVIQQLRRKSGSGVEEQTSSGVEQQNTTFSTTPLLHCSSSRDTEPVARLSTLPVYDTSDYFRTVAQLGIQAAEALDHAHASGILHRDIKPANLLVESSHLAPRDEAAKIHHAERDGYTLKLWITDFGLARIEQDAGMTMTGDILGTLRYMSPEQTMAKLGIVDHRSDIYSLGATLYELLALEPAFTGDDRHELLRRIASEEPKPPRQFNDSIPADLENIILKAIEKEPADRYATAQELRDDLQAFLEHRPVVARPASLALRSRKWLRRHRSTVAASAATLLMALVIGLVGVIVAFQRERDQRQAAQRHLELARQSVDEMLTKVASTWVADSYATSEIQRQFLQRALEIYERLALEPPDGDRRGADAAIAYEKISDIQNHLGHLIQAIVALDTAVGIGEELVATGEPDLPRAAQLVRCYRKSSEAFAADFQMIEARRAADRGIELAEGLLKQQPTWPELERELTTLLYGKAERLINSRKFAEAAAVLAEPRAQFADRLNLTLDDPVKDLVMGAELANLRATLLFRQGRFDEAIQAARSAVSLRMIALPNHFDAKPLLEQNAALLETVGQILLAQGKHQSAVEEFRNVLRLRKQRLGGRSPMEINLAVFSKEPWQRYTEPLAVADYCSTQLRLAAILPSLGRPYEAECMLGEAVETASIASDTFAPNLQLGVLHANAAAAVGQHLASRGSSESEHFLQLAAALWNEMRLMLPQAEQFQSGMHALARDWDWFRSTYPDYASRPDTRDSLKPNNFSTAFWHRTVALGWFNSAYWDSAVISFAKSAELRNEGQAFDWLHLAMAYQHLGQPEKAQTEYDRAIAQIDATNPTDAELESLRRTAERLLKQDAELESL